MRPQSKLGRGCDSVIVWRECEAAVQARAGMWKCDSVEGV